MIRYKMPTFTDNRTRTKKLKMTWFLNDSFEELGRMVYEKDTKIVNGGRFYESNRHSKTNR